MHKLLNFLKNGANLYAVILALVGLLLVFLVPPYQSPDEQTHLYRAYQLSEGHIVAKKLSYGAGDILPSSLSKSFDQYYYLLFSPDKKVDRAVYTKSIETPLNKNKTTETRFENTAIYPPFAYVPQIIAVGIGRIFNASPVILLYMARLANLATWVAILWLAMRRNGKVRLPLLAFGLVPIVAFQAASASADVVTAAVAIFFVLEVCRLLTTKAAITRNQIILLTATAVTLALCKFPYILLSLTALLIPASRFASRKSAWKARALTLGPAWAIALTWVVIAQKTFVNLRVEAQSGMQLHYILTAPLGFAKTLYNTYVSLPSDGLYIQMIGQLGWLDTKLPFWVLLCSALAVVLATLSVSFDKKSPEPTTFQRLVTLGLTLVTIGAISTLLYLTWNAPRATVIDGLQGRYYIPLFGAFLLAGGGLLKLLPEQAKRAQTIVYVLLGLEVIVTIVTIALRYYSL